MTVVFRDSRAPSFRIAGQPSRHARCASGHFQSSIASKGLLDRFVHSAPPTVLVRGDDRALFIVNQKNLVTGVM